jgi:hypothetical protein
MSTPSENGPDSRARPEQLQNELGILVLSQKVKKYSQNDRDKAQGQNSHLEKAPLSGQM